MTRTSVLCASRIERGFSKAQAFTTASWLLRLASYGRYGREALGRPRATSPDSSFARPKARRNLSSNARARQCRAAQWPGFGPMSDMCQRTAARGGGPVGSGFGSGT